MHNKMATDQCIVLVIDPDLLSKYCIPVSTKYQYQVLARIMWQHTQQTDYNYSLPMHSG